MKKNKSRFRELLAMARYFDNVDFKQLRLYLEAKERWRIKMN